VSQWNTPTRIAASPSDATTVYDKLMTSCMRRAWKRPSPITDFIFRSPRGFLLITSFSTTISAVTVAPCTFVSRLFRMPSAVCLDRSRRGCVPFGRDKQMETMGGTWRSLPVISHRLHRHADPDLAGGREGHAQREIYKTVRSRNPNQPNNTQTRISFPSPFKISSGRHFRSTCDEQWRDRIRHTPASSTTSSGRWRGRPRWIHRSRRNTSSREERRS
jgi:hypothetical protein